MLTPAELREFLQVAKAEGLRNLRLKLGDSEFEAAFSSDEAGTPVPPAQRVNGDEPEAEEGLPWNAVDPIERANFQKAKVVKAEPAAG